MTPLDAEKLLGGYATGTLSEAERRVLFEAALDRQDLFDALMDEEALRELLADPTAKAQLLAALAPAAQPNVVPFWRRTGVLGAAAGLLMAATAGLVVLRSPEQAPPPLAQVAPKAIGAKGLAELPATPGPVVPAPKRAAPAPALKPTPPVQNAPAPAPVPETVAPPPPPPVALRRSEPAMAAAPVPAEAAADRARSDYFRAEAQDRVAKKAKAASSSSALIETTGTPKEERPKGGTGTQMAQADLAPGVVSGGAVGSVAAQAPSADQGGRLRGKPALMPAAPPAKAARRPEWKAAAAYAPGWKLEALPDGSTRVLVKGPVGAQAVVLRRGTSGIQVLALRLIDPGGDMAWWRAETRLAEGDVLDLYLLNTPVPEPARLPETGPVDGYRVRIHPAGKN